MAFNLTDDRKRGFNIEVSSFKVSVKRMLNYSDRV
ncbi:MAG: hypothetical protein ANIMEMIM_00028 [Candidatus Argoarchaeum ethanivorans]|uniref:Uncharacterized protein n=1 Tax=Candidatus Argoarchaeum ethanivorans TaxID=2608793 RepID=A0A811T0Z5_9EURY|nr:MAG: hypothetical protein ANIMEMIM_00028 [Candidatus Argoarchaeum ethanivorans]